MNPPCTPNVPVTQHSFLQAPGSHPSMTSPPVNLTPLLVLEHASRHTWLLGLLMLLFSLNEVAYTYLGKC